MIQITATDRVTRIGVNRPGKGTPREFVSLSFQVNDERVSISLSPLEAEVLGHLLTSNKHSAHINEHTVIYFD